MKRLMILAALLACACAPTTEPTAATELAPQTFPIADAAGNRMEALIEQDGKFCSGDGAWCIAVGPAAVTVTHGGQDTQLMQLDTATASAPSVWPVIIREGRDDQNVQLGLAWQQDQMYSGGGGQATRVTLYRITQGSGLIPEVLTWPISAGKMIRACFSEADQRARRDACHDEYAFTGQLSLDTENANGPPRLVLTTLATTFPGDLTITEDSAERPPLQAIDIVTVRDADCSYRSVLTFNGEGYGYENEPPACSDFLEP